MYGVYTGWWSFAGDDGGDRWCGGVGGCGVDDAESPSCASRLHMPGHKHQNPHCTQSGDSPHAPLHAQRRRVRPQHRAHALVLAAQHARRLCRPRARLERADPRAQLAQVPRDLREVQGAGAGAGGREGVQALALEEEREGLGGERCELGEGHGWVVAEMGLAVRCVGLAAAAVDWSWLGPAKSARYVSDTVIEESTVTLQLRRLGYGHGRLSDW